MPGNCHYRGRSLEVVTEDVHNARLLRQDPIDQRPAPSVDQRWCLLLMTILMTLIGGFSP